MSPAPTPRLFGQLPSGELISAYRLSNAAGTCAEIITYGGILTSLRVKDSHGRFRNVVLGFEQLEPYLVGKAYYGAIVGRVAGRITGGAFSLGGRRYELARNDVNNHLHGGIKGLDKKVWSAAPGVSAAGASTLRLTCASPDGEEGYPGNLEVAVTYSLTAANEFIVETEAASDCPTPVSLTTHSYFNLAGESSGSIVDHRLQICSDHYLPAGLDGTLSSQLKPVAGGRNDLNEARRVGEVFSEATPGHGELYFVRRPAGWAGAPVLAARVTEPTSGLSMNIHTDETCLQLYTAQFFDGSQTGAGGRPYGPYCALALEAEGYPDGANHPQLDDIIVRPGAPRRRTTIHTFYKS